MILILYYIFYTKLCILLSQNMKFGSINSGLYALFLPGGWELKCAVGSSHPKRKQWEGEVEGERMCVCWCKRGATQPWA